MRGKRGMYLVVTLFLMRVYEQNWKIRGEKTKKERN